MRISFGIYLKRCATIRPVDLMEVITVMDEVPLSHNGLGCTLQVPKPSPEWFGPCDREAAHEYCQRLPNWSCLLPPQRENVLHVHVYRCEEHRDLEYWQPTIDNPTGRTRNFELHGTITGRLPRVDRIETERDLEE